VLARLINEMELAVFDVGGEIISIEENT